MPKVGEVRSDGKIYTGPKFGWQSPGTVFKRTPAGKPGEEKTIGGVTKIYTGPKFGWQTKETIQKRQQQQASSDNQQKPADNQQTPAEQPQPPKNQPVPPKQDSTPTPPRPAVPAVPQKTFQQELDDLRKASAQATMAGPSREAQALMSDRTKRMLGPEKLKAGIEGQERVEKMKNEIGIKKKEELPMKKEAYDIVLDYLFSEGHVESISEAHYVMMQMDAKYIQNIVEASSGDSGDPLGRIPKLKAEMELADLQRQRNQQRARDALRPGSYGVPSFAKHSEQQLEYGHSDAGLTKAQSRQILAQNRRDLEAAAGLKPGSTEKDAWYNDPNYGKDLDGKMKFFSPRTVLAKQRGVEGKLTFDPNTGKKTFTAGAFTDAEKARYTSKGGK